MTDEMERLLAELEAVKRERDEALRHVELLQDKVDPETSCACVYDGPDTVCLPHSPLLDAAEAEITRLRSVIREYHTDRQYIIGWNAGWDEAFNNLRFPTMLRKMWSGGEVQRWLDEQKKLHVGPASEREGGQ